MIKGVSKQVVICSDCKDTIFEQVIFILRSEAVTAGVSSRDMQSEAHRILEQSMQKFDTKVLTAPAKVAAKVEPVRPSVTSRREYTSAVGVWIVWAIVIGLVGIIAFILSLII